MKFDTPAGLNPIDQGRVVGRATYRIDGPLKTTGTATYAYEHKDVGGKPAYGYVNHDLAGYEVPVHADIPHQEVVFLDDLDPTMSPMKAKGVGELGLRGVAAAIANAVYNATGVRVRDYPITLDKLLPGLPAVA
jgi:CO/xanthine dehydrogenase Mo-binding subunit